MANSLLKRIIDLPALNLNDLLDSDLIFVGTSDNGTLYQFTVGDLKAAIQNVTIINEPQVASVATTEPLPASTYDNGAAGVGATITGDVNGALVLTQTSGDITPDDDTVILVKDEADQTRNGLFRLTQGTVSTPFVLERLTAADETSEMYPQGVVITTGDFASILFYQQTASPALGTDPIIYGTIGAINTGTDFWPLANSVGSGVLLGDTNITSNANDQLIFDGAWTASGNNQNHIKFQPSITARATALDTVGAIRFAPNLTSAALAQVLAAIIINPTYNDAFTAAHVALLHKGDVRPIGNNIFNLGANGINYAAGFITDLHGTTITIATSTGASSLLFNDESGQSAARVFTGLVAGTNLGFVGFQIGSKTFITSSNTGPMIEAFGSIKGWGDLIIAKLGTPSIASVVRTGANDGQTYTYKVVAVTGGGIETEASAAVTITDGATTQSPSNYNTITIVEVKGARKYKVYRTAGGAAQGLIQTVFGLTVADTGLVATPATPSDTNLTGVLGIGTSNPQAALDVQSSVQGALLPRMTKAERDAMPSPHPGELVFVTDNGGYLSWYNSGWFKVTSTSD